MSPDLNTLLNGSKSETKAHYLNNYEAAMQQDINSLRISQIEMPILSQD